eukprot:1007963-Rhodomonas_salina.1
MDPTSRGQAPKFTLQLPSLLVRSSEHARGLVTANTVLGLQAGWEPPRRQGRPVDGLFGSGQRALRGVADSGNATAAVVQPDVARMDLARQHRSGP